MDHFIKSCDAIPVETALKLFLAVVAVCGCVLPVVAAMYPDYASARSCYQCAALYSGAAGTLCTLGLPHLCRGLREARDVDEPSLAIVVRAGAALTTAGSLAMLLMSAVPPDVEAGQVILRLALSVGLLAAAVCSGVWAFIALDGASRRTEAAGT